MKRTIKTYTELADWFRLYNQKTVQILIVNSSPGLGKSTIARKMIKDFELIEGRITAASLYDRLYLARDKLIVIDDIDDIYKDRQSVNLLKCLCQTEEIKRLSWQTRTNRVNSPMEFETTSKVMILTNRWDRLNEHIGAIEDRGILLQFVPSATEVHHFVVANKMPIDKEVMAYMENSLSMVLIPSIRYYVNLSIIKREKLDWQSTFFETIGLDADEIIAVKLHRQEGLTNTQKAKEFNRLTGKSEKTYSRIIKKFP